LAECEAACDEMLYALDRLCQRIKVIGDIELADKMAAYIQAHSRAVEVTHSPTGRL
jgi:hypothetical protein